MPTGSCLCGRVKIAYTGEPIFTATCHCTDCRKMGNFATYQIPEASFSIMAGELKVYTKTSDFGREISTHFCPDCATVVFRTGGAPQLKGMIGLRAGVLDDEEVLAQGPKMEVYVEKRPKWTSKIEGATQLNGKYEVVE